MPTPTPHRIEVTRPRLFAMRTTGAWLGLVLLLHGLLAILLDGAIQVHAWSSARQAFIHLGAAAEQVPCERSMRAASESRSGLVEDCLATAFLQSSRSLDLAEGGGLPVLRPACERPSSPAAGPGQTSAALLPSVRAPPRG
jgi:hypothetical protein